MHSESDLILLRLCVMNQCFGSFVKELNILLNIDQKDRNLIDSEPEEDKVEETRSVEYERQKTANITADYIIFILIKVEKSEE